MSYLYIYICAAMLTMLATTPWAARLAWKLRILDRPGVRSIHTRGVPRTGGIAIASAAGLTLAAGLLAGGHLTSGAALTELLAVFGGALAVAGVGLIDDKRSLPAWLKLSAEVLVASAVWAAGVRIEQVGTDGGWLWQLRWASAPITVLWIVVMVNALNLIDGLDGLASGISILACGTIALLAIRADQPLPAVLTLAVAGAASGFLASNMHPARVFLGDCGSLFLGFVIGCGSVMCADRSANLTSLALPALAMCVPILDLTAAILRRISGRRSIFSPDLHHVHHRLLAMGMSQLRAALLLQAASLIAVGIGLLMFLVRGYRCLVIFLCAITLLGVVFHWAGAFPFRKMFRTLGLNLAIARQLRSDRRNFEEAQLQLSLAGSLESWWNGVCLLADRAGFRSLLMTIDGPDNVRNSRQWDAAFCPFHENGMVCVDLSLCSDRPQVRLYLTCQVPVNGSVELAARRAALFGRLIDEHAPFRGWAMQMAA